MVAADYGGLHAAASDPEIWAQHPSPDRWKPEVYRPYFDSLLASRATLAMRDVAQDRIIGCSRYYTAPDMPGTISIGFTFLARAYWGGAANRAVKGLMLAHAFADFDAVWFHIGPDNIRSQKATMKLGARHVYDATLDMGGGTVPWRCYRLNRDAWQPAM
ncbi:GNAT family N-acetyltransferase [Pseudohalocynthiibacter aestuariivivens]|nr:GNAT family N-acetyltransferase [Pseudohalocynthiibacter aestuariivivens]